MENIERKKILGGFFLLVIITTFHFRIYIQSFLERWWGEKVKEGGRGDNNMYIYTSRYRAILTTINTLF